MEKISRWRQRISQVRKIRGLLENRLMKPKAMRVGSVVKQSMFCGKPSCACHEDPKKKHGRTIIFPIKWEARAVISIWARRRVRR